MPPVDVGQVYRVDASRRSTALNAYVDGIGTTKRVVIYDNALRELRPAELGAESGKPSIPTARSRPYRLITALTAASIAQRDPVFCQSTLGFLGG